MLFTPLVKKGFTERKTQYPERRDVSLVQIARLYPTQHRQSQPDRLLPFRRALGRLHGDLHITRLRLRREPSAMKRQDWTQRMVFEDRFPLRCQGSLPSPLGIAQRGNFRKAERFGQLNVISQNSDGGRELENFSTHGRSSIGMSLPDHQREGNRPASFSSRSLWLRNAPSRNFVRHLHSKPQDRLQDWRSFPLSHPMGEGWGEGAVGFCVAYPTATHFHDGLP